MPELLPRGQTREIIAGCPGARTYSYQYDGAYDLPGGGQLIVSDLPLARFGNRPPSLQDLAQAACQ